MPVGVPQVGWVVLATVGVVGAPGAVFIVTVEAAFVIQVLSVVLRTLKVYVPAANPEKVALDW